MKHLVRAVGFISAIAVAVGFFAFVVYGFSTSPRVMQQLMVRHVDIPSSGLPEE